MFSFEFPKYWLEKYSPHKLLKDHFFRPKLDEVCWINSVLCSWKADSVRSIGFLFSYCFWVSTDFNYSLPMFDHNECCLPFTYFLFDNMKGCSSSVVFWLWTMNEDFGVLPWTPVKDSFVPLVDVSSQREVRFYWMRVFIGKGNAEHPAESGSQSFEFLQDRVRHYAVWVCQTTWQGFVGLW